MARDHARILCAVWRDDAWTSLRAVTQQAFVLILSQPRLSLCGTIDYTPARWARLAGDTTPASIEEAVQELEDARFVVVDRASDELLIRTFVKHDGVCDSPNLIVAMWKAWDATFSRALKAAVVAELPDVAFRSGFGAEKSRPQYEPPAQAVEMRSGNPSSNPSPKGSPKGSGTPVPVPTPSPVPSPTPVNEAPASQPPATAKPRGHRLPDTFRLTDEMRAYAAQKHPDLDVEAQTEHFRDYWRAESGAKASKLDWTAAWRTWLRNAERWAARPTGGSAVPAGRAGNRARLQAIADRNRQQAAGELG